MIANDKGASASGVLLLNSAGTNVEVEEEKPASAEEKVEDGPRTVLVRLSFEEDASAAALPKAATWG